MTDYVAYEPPGREYADTMLAFRDFEMASTWCVRIGPDPLGPVNRIVTLMRGGIRVKSALTRVSVGATVRLVRDEGAWTIDNLFALRNRLWDSRGSDEPAPTIDVQPPGWRVEVDGKTVLAVTDALPDVPPAPRVPLWRRFRYWTATRARLAADGVAGWVGYHRASECGGGW